EPSDGLDGDGRVVEARQEREVPAIGGDRELLEGVEAVDALLQRRQLVRGGAIAVGYRAVGLEPTWVVGRRLDAQDDACLVVHLDGGGPDVVLEARPLDAGVEVVAELFGVVGVELVLAPEERGDLLRLHRMDGGAYQGLVDGLEVYLPAEDDVGRVLDLG